MCRIRSTARYEEEENTNVFSTNRRGPRLVAFERHTSPDGLVRNGQDFWVGCINGSFIIHKEVSFSGRDDDVACQERVCECSGHPSHYQGGVSLRLSLCKLTDSVSLGTSPLRKRRICTVDAAPRQSVGGGKFIQNRYLCLFPLLKTTALRGD